jgi:hypothetical protein
MKASTINNTSSISEQERARKAGFLRRVLVLILVVLPIAFISDFLTGDLVNSAFEASVFVAMAVAFFILQRGNYVLASRITILAAGILLLLMSMVTGDHPVTSQLRLSRNFPPGTILGIMAMGEGYAKVSNL